VTSEASDDNCINNDDLAPKNHEPVRKIMPAGSNGRMMDLRWQRFAGVYHMPHGAPCTHFGLDNVDGRAPSYRGR
jgi:hypothetical protein